MYLVIEADCVTKYLLIVLEGRTSARSVRHDQEALYHMTTNC